MPTFLLRTVRELYKQIQHFLVTLSHNSNANTRHHSRVEIHARIRWNDCGLCPNIYLVLSHSNSAGSLQ